MIFYPKIIQPTHARWEYIPPAADEPAHLAHTNGITNGDHAANGVVDHSAGERAPTNGSKPPDFPPIPAVISRNFTVVDLSFSSPPISGAGFPGPDGFITDPMSGTAGLAGIPQELIDELPAECRVAFEQARATELSWREQWSTEAHSGHRGTLKIGFNGYPV
jgi:chromatin structure-remodeling complex protein RSC7